MPPTMPQYGPIYVETDPSRFIVEPWNTASGILFYVVVAWWAWRLRGQWRRFPFLTGCLPILAAGAVGGTVYHAFRGHWAWLFLDWVPIAILTTASSIWAWWGVLRRRWLIGLVVPLLLVLQRGAFRFLPHGWAINFAYACLAANVVVPVVLLLARTRWAHGRWPLAAAVCFALALAARVLDRPAAAVLPMGSHFLWHIFGAAACHCGFLYIYWTVAGDDVRKEYRITNKE